jgi:CRP/FNR family transcriptional regulator, dissimilatory nitrate respiration regulator
MRSPFPASIRALAVDRTLRRGQPLFKISCRDDGIYQVISGRLNLMHRSPIGGEEIISIARAGDMLAQACVFSKSLNCAAFARTDATLRLYPKAALLKELDRDPKFARRLLDMLAKEIVKLRTRMQLRGIRNAHDRVRAYLKLNAGKDGRTVPLSGTVMDLAIYLGLTHESLYRTLAAMKARGEIMRSAGKITLSKGFNKRRLRGHYALDKPGSDRTCMTSKALTAPKVNTSQPTRSP